MPSQSLTPPRRGSDLASRDASPTRSIAARLPSRRYGGEAGGAESPPRPASPRGRNGADRAVSDVVALALLIGLVLSGALLVAGVGGDVVDDVRDHTATTEAIRSLQEVDATLSSLSREGAATTLSLPPQLADGFAVERDGSITVSIDGDRCAATIPLSSLVYRGAERGQSVRYEAGGIWVGAAGRARVVAPPDVAYVNRTVHLSVIRFGGTVDGARLRARSPGNSTAATRALENDLFADPSCLRPDDVTLTVRSPLYRAWGRYLVEEFEMAVAPSAVIDHGNRTASVRIPDAALPRAADDERNRVVDFDDGYGVQRDGWFTVDKGVPSLTYPVSITVLTSESQGAVPHVTVDRDRHPLDVVLTLDESTSMAGRKLAATRSAATGFVGHLDAATGDRVALVGYSSPIGWFDICDRGEDARLYAELSGEFDRVNHTISDELYACGYTPIAAAINRSVDHVVSSGGGGDGDEDDGGDDGGEHESRERVVVLLSDGRHNGPGSVRGATERAATNAVTIFTVGFGADADETRLRAIANRTGGAYYHASDATELSDSFEAIALDVTRLRSVRPTPVTMRAGTHALLPNGTLRAVPSNGTVHNLRDPTVGDSLGFASHLRDGQGMPVGLTAWGCDAWERTNASVAGPDGGDFRIARCEDATDRIRTIDPNSSTTRLRTFTGEDTFADLPDGSGSWPEQNLTTILRSNGLLESTGALDLESNEVVLAYDLPDGESNDGDFNDLVVLVEVGYGRGEVRVPYVVQMRVRAIELSRTP